MPKTTTCNIISMKALTQYIAELRSQKDLWPKVEPLVKHITYLEAELRLAKLRLDGQPQILDDIDLDKKPFSTIKTTAKNKDLSLTERNLYRAVGELSFVIAKADNILREDERKAFHQVIKEEFGENSWIAEDRFTLIEKTPTSDVESTYNHVLFMIRQNKHGLTEELVETFIRVITRVAEVANIHENQMCYITRFEEDLARVFAQN